MVYAYGVSILSHRVQFPHLRSSLEEGIAHGELQELIWNGLKGYEILIFRRKEFAETNYAQLYSHLSVNYNMYASKQKSRHQAARGALNKLPEATGAHGAPQIPLEGVQGVMLISTG